MSLARSNSRRSTTRSLDFDRAYGVVLEGHLLRDVRMIVASVALRF